MNRVIESLKSSEVFGNLDRDRLERLSGLSRPRHFRQDEIIFEEGAEATNLYILRSGMAVLEMRLHPVPDRPPIPTPLESITPGECFGWSAIVEPHTYTLSARCQTDCSTLAILGSRLHQEMAADPELGCEVQSAVSRLVARRLADTRLRLTSGVGLILQQHEIAFAVPG